MDYAPVSFLEIYSIKIIHGEGHKYVSQWLVLHETDPKLSFDFSGEPKAHAQAKELLEQFTGEPLYEVRKLGYIPRDKAFEQPIQTFFGLPKVKTIGFD